MGECADDPVVHAVVGGRHARSSSASRRHDALEMIVTHVRVPDGTPIHEDVDELHRPTVPDLADVETTKGRSRGP